MNNKIILKTYKDYRINKELKKCLIKAINDDEFDIRYDENYGLEDFTILMENIDKLLIYVNNGCVGELRLNSNIWEVCLETLVNILKLYGLRLIGEKTITEDELVIPIHVGYLKKVFDKMKEYGWNLGDNRYEDFYNVYMIHKRFLDNTYDLVHDYTDYNEKFDMNKVNFQNFSDMLDFTTDFLRALNEVDKITD